MKMLQWLTTSVIIGWIGLGCASWQKMPTSEKVQRSVCAAMCAVKPFMASDVPIEQLRCAAAYGFDKGLILDVVSAGDCVARCLADYSKLDTAALESCVSE